MDFTATVIVLGLVSSLCGCHGQLLSREELHTIQECDLNLDVNLTCNSTTSIAVESIRYGFNPNCISQCCQFNAYDCLRDASNIEDLKRVCSGKSYCIVPIQKRHTLCSYGTVTPSYVYVEYYCIPGHRTASVCSAQTIVSNRQPVYLTNPDYPGVTIGSRSCNCYFEIKSCTSNSSIYIIDADLYKYTSFCQQSLEFRDAKGDTKKRILCEGYYDQFISKSMIGSNYLQVNFESHSTSNLEGYLFIGIEASEENVSFTLTCSSVNVPAKLCIVCSQPPSVSNGNVTLDDPTNNTFVSTATVSCNPGYDQDKTKISCLASGVWEQPKCIIKDCGALYSISHGALNLSEDGRTLYGSTATVECEVGYYASKDTIECRPSGYWENASCSIYECNQESTTSNGSTLIIAVLLVLGIICLAQFVLGIFIQRRIYQNCKENIGHNILCIAMGTLPVFGIAALVWRCRYPRNKDKEEQRVTSAAPNSEMETQTEYTAHYLSSYENEEHPYSDLNDFTNTGRTVVEGTSENASSSIQYQTLTDMGADTTYHELNHHT